MTTARLLCILLLLAGCTQHSRTDSLRDRGRYDSLQPGISTKQDVYQRFGQPVAVLAVEGGSTWLYAQAQTPRQGAIAEVTLATFGFDSQDRYQRVDTRRARRAQSPGSGTGGTPLGDAAAAHVREEMARCGLPFDEAVWDAGAQAHRLWTQPPAARE
jgi:outer membrane protein assembly factor BamE (lipoprotein component of BamABCDE complex)